MSSRVRVECPVCGREVGAYVPRGGDGTALRPYPHIDRWIDAGLGRMTAAGRRARRCRGRFELVDLADVGTSPLLEPRRRLSRRPLNISVGFRPGAPDRQTSELREPRAALLRLLARRLARRQGEEALGGPCLLVQGADVAPDRLEVEIHGGWEGSAGSCPRCCTEPCRRGSGRFCGL